MTMLEHSGFPSSARFEPRGRLGTGAMGVVYRAYDRSHRIEVALKTLRSLDGTSLYRFKNEFRSLSGIVHANLVTLYELQSRDDEWFFTMELVEGTSFLEYVRPHRHLLAAAPDAVEDGSELETATARTGPSQHLSSASERRRAYLANARLDRERLRAALPQLVGGLDALHRAGKLHRDVKPSNVLVDPRGRVVVCDFGLVTPARPDPAVDADRRLAGTPVYMSPEQASGDPLGPESDWYSLGVMLYEALTGQLPHSGELDEVLEKKRTTDPEPPHRLDPSIDSEWSQLCLALLDRVPARRPSAADILRALDADSSPPRVREPAPSSDQEPFVGREAQRAALRDALDNARRGRGTSVLVSGRSGMGKTALMRRFLADATADGDVLVLEGRCYERESVPYKALDGLVDAVSSLLLAMPGDEAGALMPADIGSLARLFPVLLRINAVRVAANRAPLPQDPQDLRFRAFRALRDVLAGLAATRTTIVYIDDLQWGDVDSAFLLDELIHHPESPSLLVVGCYRSDEVGTSPLLQSLLRRNTAETGESPVRTVTVEPLERTEARALARAVLEDDSETADRAADEIAREAGGNPLFVHELARVASRHRAGPAAGRLNLDDILHQRIIELPAEARALLTASSVAGRPTALDIVSRAAGVHDQPSALAVLIAEHLARTRTSNHREEIEPAHDRVREVATARISELDLRRIHRALARAYEHSDRGDPQALVEHWLGAGVPDRAATYAVRAAEQAEQTLAFDRAVHHYRLALELLEQGPSERRAMQVRLASALANSGSLAESAEAYLTAADGAEPDVAGELRRRALKQLLRSGRNDEGLSVAHEVVRDVGLKLPRSRPAALLSVVISRARLAVRGVQFQARAPEQIRDHEIRRLDVFWSVGSGLSLVDPVLGAAFQMRNLLTALRVGEPYRAALALSMELGYRSYAGGRARDHVTELMRTTRRLAERANSPHAIGVCLATTGLAHFSMGDFDDARATFERAEPMLLDNGERWDVDVCRTYRMGALWYLGRIAELRGQVTALVREAVEIGDAFLARGLRAGRSNAAWLAADEPAEARRQVELAAIEKRTRAFHMPHFYDLYARCQIDLYEGDGVAAWRRMNAAWRALERSMLMRRSESIRISARFLRARCALAAAAADPPNRRRYLRAAEIAARRLEREQNHWNHPKAALVRACMASLVRDGDAAAELGYAIEGFEALGMTLHAEACRHRLGALQGGTAGDESTARATAWMRGESIVRPDRLARMLVPAIEP